MQIRSIAMNAASLAAEQAVQKNGVSIQPEGNVFGSSCSVTISREGRNLSRQLQEAQGGQNTAGVKEVRQQLRQLERAELEKEAEEYDKKLKNAEETESAEETERAWNDPDVDAELKAALLEMAEENAGGALSDEGLKGVKEQYEHCRQMMAQGYTINVLCYSDGVIDDRKVLLYSKSKTGKGHCEVVKDPEQAAGLMGGALWKTGKIGNASDVDWTKESIDTTVNATRSWLMRSFMTPSRLERYSREELLERIEKRCEQIREELNGYLPSSGFGFSDEEMAEYNKKPAASQIPLDEQQKKPEELAGRFTPDDFANVTRLDLN